MINDHESFLLSGGKNSQGYPQQQHLKFTTDDTVPVSKIGQVPAVSVATGVTDADDSGEIWCVCRKPYGGRNMIECESSKCPFKWFHLDCIGLAPNDVPVGKWYCSTDACLQTRSLISSSGRKRKRNDRLLGHYTM